MTDSKAVCWWRLKVHHHTVENMMPGTDSMVLQSAAGISGVVVDVLCGLTGVG